jgi:phenylpropionate dioxygenase-like ring-hydroxylating dioxygenase large terminal subunit
MFEGFARVWTPVILARSLGDRPVGVVLAGERVVLFRDRHGGVGALVDRCPHRGVKLSLGRVTPDGHLECPFHAWQFDRSGAATLVPLNPDAKRDNLTATALPAREIGGLVWVHTAPGAHAPSEPLVPDGLTRPDCARTFLSVEWKAHWTRAMENMLDSPHVPFVHARTIGRFVRPLLRPGSRMDITWEETPYGGRTGSTLDGREAGGASLDFYAPNMMVLHIPVPEKVFRMHAIAVPVDDTCVRMIVVGARSFARLSILNPLFNRQNLKIVREDQAVVESSDPPRVPAQGGERSVRTDRATLRFRKYYLDTLAESSA